MAKKSQKLDQAKHYHVRAKDREYFTSNLALLLKASVAVGDGLQSLRDATKSRPLRLAIEQMQRDIDEGMPLWKALERSRIVSNQTLALVHLGEESGNLAENLHVAALQEEKQHMFRAKVRSALLYPVFVLSLTVIVGLGVAWFLLPRMAETFTHLGVALPLISVIFINFGLFLQSDGWWAVPVAIGIIGVLGYILFAAPKTKGIGQQLLFHVPGVSRLLHEIEIARFGYLFGTLLDAGLNVTDALRLLHDATSSAAYQKFYLHLASGLEEGYSFRVSLPAYKNAAKLIPPAVQQMVIAGERSGALPETLQNVGEIYEEKADISTQNLEAILEPILLVIVWLGVLGVAVAVILPIYSLVGGLGT